MPRNKPTIKKSSSVIKRIFVGVVILLIIIACIVGFLFLRNNSIKSMTTVALPSPQLKGAMSIEEAIQQRRSVRDYKDEPVTLQQVSQLLWAAQGITAVNGFRATPSAGATYPLEIYLVSGDVTNLPPGVYHYLPVDNSVELVTDGDKRKELLLAATQQPEIQQAKADIIIAAVYKRTTAKYGSRGERFVQMEAGHAAENIYLQAQSLGLGTVAIGLFDDASAKTALSLPAEDEPLYIMPVGKK